MTRRVPFDGAQQEQALRSLLTWSKRRLKTRSGKTLEDVAMELNMSPATLGRYLSGVTPLCSDQFGPFARAFETEESSLIAGCFPTLTVSPAQQQREIRARLRIQLEAGSVPEDEIREVLSEALGIELTPESASRIGKIVISHDRRVTRRRAAN